MAGAAVARPQHPIDVEGAAPPRPIRGPRARPPGGLVVLLVGASLRERHVRPPEHLDERDAGSTHVVILY